MRVFQGFVRRFFFLIEDEVAIKKVQKKCGFIQETCLDPVL